MSKPIREYPAPYDYSYGDPYGGKGPGIYFDASGVPQYITNDPGAGGGSGGGSGDAGSSIRSGGVVSTQTNRTGDTTLTATGGDSNGPVTPEDTSGGLNGLLASPLQALFNLALAQASQPKPGAIVLPPDQAASGSSFMSLKNIILIVLIGGGIWYVVRKYANK